MVTLGFNIIASWCCGNWESLTADRSGSPAWRARPGAFQLQVRPRLLLLILAWAAIVGRLATGSCIPAGRAFRAIRENEMRASGGVSLRNYS